MKNTTILAFMPAAVFFQSQKKNKTTFHNCG